jgi:phosphatidylglycerol---prolipoprotein diacylglyceryl transferase
MFAYYTHNLSPFLIRFHGNIGLRYYGLAYALGFLGLYAGLRWQAARGWSRLHGEDITDFITWMIAGIIIGGRLGYCLLYGWEMTRQHPLSIFYVWQGGMASHGGIAGSIAAIYFYARHRKIPFYNLADAAALCCPPALLLGRIANFINGELWGRPGTVSWAVIFPDAPLVNGVNVPRHPSQIYEAFLEGALLFTILLIIRFRAKKDGAAALAFMALYPVMRIIGECFREPDTGIGYYWNYFTEGQLLSLGMFTLAVVLAVIQWRSRQGQGRS